MNKEEFKLEKELIDYKHKLKMEELDFDRKTIMINHENVKEATRIRIAEENKLLNKKMNILRERAEARRKN